MMMACGVAEVDATPGLDADRLQTTADRYAGYERPEVAHLADGLHGVIKVVGEHGMGAESVLVAQGTGSLWVADGQWFVVTARHVVVPDTDQVPQEAALWTRVALGPLGVIPQTVWVSPIEDIAILEVTGPERAELLSSVYLDSARPIAAGEVAVGWEVEAWGFPSRHLPQLEKPSVAAVQPEYLALNSALQGGYSGGPLLVRSRSGSSKRVVGLIVRADDEADQTTTLPWQKVHDALVATVNDAGTMIELPVPGMATVDGRNLISHP